jgi:hypothetical protein
VSLRQELRDPWGILVGGLACGLGWAVGIPIAAAAGIGATVWGVRAASGAVFRGTAPDAASFDADGVRRSLERLRKRIARRVPDDVMDAVVTIIETMEAILPRVGSLGPGSQDLFVLARTATDYLPTALESYVNLPRKYATAHPIRGGKTAHELLVDQLELLQVQLDGIALAVNKNDTDKLLAHGRFLEERFGAKDLSLDPGSSEPA